MALAALAMQDLAGSIARDPALAARWHDLADLDHGACLIRDNAARRLELVGATAAAVRINDTAIALTLGRPAPLPPAAHVEADCAGRRFALPPADLP